LKADTSDHSIERKVRRAKPAGVADFCLLSNDLTQTNPDPTKWNKVTNPAACDADPFLRAHSSPRQVAGSPLSENILKCRLKPLNSADYAPVVLTSAQLARLSAVFPDGVCDWSKDGVGQRRARAPRDYSDGPGGEQLGSAPDSHEHGHHHHRGHGRGDDDDDDD